VICADSFGACTLRAAQHEANALSGNAKHHFARRESYNLRNRKAHQRQRLNLQWRRGGKHDHPTAAQCRVLQVNTGTDRISGLTRRNATLCGAGAGIANFRCSPAQQVVVIEIPPPSWRRGDIQPGLVLGSDGHHGLRNVGGRA
jgi:hypothetical protein